MKEGELASLRQTATSWRNAGVISAGFALAGGLTAGPDVLAGLSEPARIASLIALGVGVVTGLVSVAFAVRSSVGWPKSMKTQGPMSWAGEERKEVLTVQRLVRCSMVLSAFAVGALVIAVAVALVDIPGERTLLVTDSNGTFCARNITVVDGSVIVHLGDALVEVPRKEVVSMASVETCP